MCITVVTEMDQYGGVLIKCLHASIKAQSNLNFDARFEFYMSNLVCNPTFNSLSVTVKAQYLKLHLHVSMYM